EQRLLSYQTFTSRTADATAANPDFQGGDIASGASMSGAIGFQLLNGTNVASVVYAPSTYDQQVIVGEPGAGGSPQVKPTPRPTTRATPTEAAATAVASASAADCAGVVPWAQGTLGRLSQVGTIVAPISALANQPNATVDPTSTRQIATQLQTLADDQRNSNPPPAAADLNTVVVTAFQNFADAINKLADAAQATNTTPM